MNPGGVDVFAALTRQAFDVLAAATPYVHQFFFDRLGISAAARRKFVERALRASERRRAERRIRAQPIPRVIHRLWLTDATNPHSPPATFMDRIAAQMAALGEAYACLFWSNSEPLLKALAAERPGARIQYLSTAALSHDPLLARVSLAIAARKYVLAGDILKFLLMARLGGVYADLGVDFRSGLLDVVMDAEVSLYLSHDLFFQPALMAAPPLSPPFQMFRKLLLRPEILAALCVDLARHEGTAAEIWTHGGVGFSAALMLFYDETYNLLPVAPTPGLLHVESLRSWYGEGDGYGGVKLGEAPATHIDAAQCALLQKRFAAVSAAGASPSSIARLKLIDALAGAYLVEGLDRPASPKRWRAVQNSP